jgi:hypothetical protein
MRSAAEPFLERLKAAASAPAAIRLPTSSCGGMKPSVSSSSPLPVRPLVGPRRWDAMMGRGQLRAICMAVALPLLAQSSRRGMARQGGAGGRRCTLTDGILRAEKELDAMRVVSGWARRNYPGTIGVIFALWCAGELSRAGAATGGML